MVVGEVVAMLATGLLVAAVVAVFALIFWERSQDREGPE